MTDYPFENFNHNTPEDQTSEPEQKVGQSASFDASPENPVTDPQPVSAEPAYTDIYANSADYKEADPSKQEGKPYEPERESDPYGNYFRSADAAPHNAKASDSAAPQTGKNYEDGFYHQSFSSQHGTSHVNYTHPSATYVNPQAAQPNSPRYASPAAPRSSQPYTNNNASDKPKSHRKKGVRMTKGGIALLLVVCVLIAGAAGFGGSMLASKLNQPTLEATANDTMVIHKVDTEVQAAGTEALVDKTTSEIANDVADTVVEITTEIMQTNSFYGQYIAQGAGSGVIISNDGYILTNNHVIDGASSVKVTTRNGDSYDAQLIGTDSEVDIALLKIEANDLKAAVFGDSDKLTVGSKAVIIGNPLGTLGGSVTEGIISALDRSIVIDGKTMHLMQTDAAINPGNSGGGMFNGQGELSGIVVAKSSSSSESIDNIGFVIPINTVLNIVGDLKESGYVRGRADTGMDFIDLTNQMYAYYYFGNNSAGVYISSVDSGSNAAEAGFKTGDRVISVDGHEISKASEIESLISEKSAGDTVTFELERGGSKGKLELTLEEYVPEAKKSTNSSDSGSESNPFGNGGGQNPYNPFSGLFD